MYEALIRSYQRSHLVAAFLLSDRAVSSESPTVGPQPLVSPYFRETYHRSARDPTYDTGGACVSGRTFAETRPHSMPDFSRSLTIGPGAAPAPMACGRLA